RPAMDIGDHYVAAFGQDAWGIAPKLTVNYGLRVEWEDGISEDNGRMIVGFDPAASLANAGAGEAGSARWPLPQLPASIFHVTGGPIYSGASASGATWKPETM